MGSTSVQAPAPRNIATEAGDTLRTQIDLAPQQLAAYQATAGGYADTDRTNLFNAFTADNGILALNQILAGQTAAANRDANSAQRVADMGDLGKYGGDLLALQKSFNPEMYGAMDAYGARAIRGVDGTAAGTQAANIASRGFGTYTPQAVGGVAGSNAVNAGQIGYDQVQAQTAFDKVNADRVAARTGFDSVRSQQGDLGLGIATGKLLQGTGPGAIQQTLEGQAMGDLAMGGRLSEQETRDAQQAARAAYAARGLGNTNASVAAEVLNLDNAQRARLNERRAFAQGVDQQGFGQRQQDFGNTLNYSGQAQNYGQMGLAAQQANLGAQLQGNSQYLQAGLANQSSSLAAQQANLAAQLQGNEQALRAQLANQSAGLQAGQFNANQSLQAQLANQGDAYQRAALNTNINQFNSGQNQDAFGMNLQALQSQYSALNTSDQEEMNRQRLNNQMVQNYAGLRQNSQFDPALGVLGRSSINQGTTAGLFGQGQGSVAGSNAATRDQFNPFNSYASDLNSTNYNGAYSANAQTAGNNANMIGGLFSAAGSLGGAGILKYCWVAREVYGINNPRWLAFREWMFTKAPEALRAAYIENGERLAYRLNNKPRLKAKLRAWMDAQLMEDSYAV